MSDVNSSCVDSRQTIGHLPEGSVFAETRRAATHSVTENVYQNNVVSVVVVLLLLLLVLLLVLLKLLLLLLL